MTVSELAALLRRCPNPDQEIGFQDGEGHWSRIEGLRRVLVDAADFVCIREKPTDPQRECIEITDCSDFAEI